MSFVPPKSVFHIAKKGDFPPKGKSDYYTGPEGYSEPFLHLSASKHVKDTCRIHLNGIKDLVLVKIDTEKLPNDKAICNLVWETPTTSRDTLDPFPHLYFGKGLPLNSVLWVKEIGWDESKKEHTFPNLDD